MYGQVAMIIGLISMLGYAAHSWKVSIETNYAIRLEARLEKQANEFREKSAKKTAKLADKQHEKELSAKDDKHNNEMRFKELSTIIERMKHEQPFKASNLYEYNIRRIVCKIAKGGDKADRDTCDRFEANAENYTPELASFITVTRETTDYWNEQCDAGVKSFCDYAIMGLTEQGSRDLLDDFNDIDFYQLQLNYSEDAKIEALKYLRDMKTTEEKN